jgi:hypothetical protein
MEKYCTKKDASTQSSKIATNESRVEQKRPRIELDMNEIVADPGLRKPIEEFHHDIREQKIFCQLKTFSDLFAISISVLCKASKICFALCYLAPPWSVSGSATDRGHAV